MKLNIFQKNMQDSHKLILHQNNIFYRKLSPEEKEKFEFRVLKFINHHQFIGKEDFKVNEKTKLLIAGTAIMLSFGFREFLFSLFPTIIIYPTNYYSPQTKTLNKGETNPQFGIIVFSWEDFKAGIIIENDNRHLGLHEFTHALHFGYQYDITFEGNRFLRIFKKILLHLEETSIQKKLIEKGYIRGYAFENQYEFLAVLIEHFFETPKKFKEEHPVIYKLIKKLLKYKKK
jgi:Mlc titration factor MtfA (ptsG expression regulator)